MAYIPGKGSSAELSSLVSKKHNNAKDASIIVKTKYEAELVKRF